MSESETIEPVDPKHASAARRVAWSLSAVTILLLAVGVIAVKKLGQSSLPPRLDIPAESEIESRISQDPSEELITELSRPPAVRPQVLQPQVGVGNIADQNLLSGDRLGVTPILPNSNEGPWRESLWPEPLEPQQIRAARLPEQAAPSSNYRR